MIENNVFYNLAKEYAPQSFRNQIRSNVRSLVDVYAVVRGLNPNRATPDFIMVGAQKAGTTSLFNWLVESGFVQAPLVKEIGYFDSRWDRAIKYRGYFKTEQPDQLVGEATPSYLAFPEVPERIVTTLGADCKIIIVLRDPIDRAVSHYFHECRLGYEKRDMYRAMVEEDALIEEALDEATTAIRRRYILTHCSYVYRSTYSARLAPWFEQFDRANLCMINSESMFANPKETVDSVAQFLGAEKINPIEFTARNKNSYVFEDERAAAFLQNRLSSELSHYNNWDY